MILASTVRSAADCSAVSSGLMGENPSDSIWFHKGRVHRSGFLGSNCGSAQLIGCRFEQLSNPFVDAVLHQVTGHFDLIFVRGNRRASNPGSVDVLMEVVLRSSVSSVMRQRAHSGQHSTSVVLRSEVRKLFCVPWQVAQLGGNSQGAAPDPHPERTGRRSLVVAAGIEAPETRGLYLPKSAKKRRIYRSAELPEEHAEIGRGIGTAEADLSGDPAHDCNAGSRERDTQGHPRAY
jgi:hypothetical protein